MKFDACIGFTLREEGGLSLDPKDRGNWLGTSLVGSNFGISAQTLALWLRDQRKPSTPADVARAMRELSTPTVFAIYRARYWNVVRGDDLATGVDLMVFDHAVNAGQPDSARLLQSIVGVETDGVIGPVTLAAAAKLWPSDLIDRLHAAQQQDYRGDRDFPLYGGVWMGRLARASAVARDMNLAATKTITGEAL